MKKLYVSDLDGTLLRSNQTVSEYTKDVIASLTRQGVLFSYATARSAITARKVVGEIDAKIPVIVYNGAFVIDNVTDEIMLANYFDEDIREVFADLFNNNIYPIVYAYIDGVEKFSFIEDKCTRGMRAFLDSRKGDIRTNAVKSPEELTVGNCFYITCIDEPQALEPIFDKYKDKYHCVYQKDIYTDEQWLEIMPKTASKSNAILQLKEQLKCDKVVVFGDGKNDIDMFEIADESYAMENAVEELKEKATAVISSNDDDGVAKWLAANSKHNH